MPPGSDTSTATASAVGDVAAWCWNFAERRSSPFRTAPLRESGTSTGLLTPGKPELSLVELSVPITQTELAGSDLLVLTLTRRAAREQGATAAVAVRVLTPRALHSFMRSGSAAVVINDVPIHSLDLPGAALSILLYRLHATSRVNQLIAAIDSMADQVNARDPENTTSELARPLLERLGLLDHAQGAARLFGMHNLQLPDAAAAREQFLALTPGRAERTLWLLDRQLRDGATLNASVPVAGEPYLLLRIGPRSTQESVRLYIENQRKDHALKRAQLSGAPGSESYEAFVQRERQQRRKRLIESIFGHSQIYPLVNPLALEVASNLEATVALATDPPSRFQTVLDEVRADTLRDHGVQVPGVRVRLNETDMLANTYLVIIGETPLALGDAQPDLRLVLSPSKIVRAAGFAATDASAPDLLRTPAAWIAADRAAEAERLGFVVWDPAQYIAMHVQEIVAQNLCVFTGTDEIVKRLQADARPALLDLIDAAPGGLPRFRAVLHTLLDERLSIAPIGVLAERYLESVDAPSFELSESLRMTSEMRACINRRLDKSSVFGLTSAFEETLREHTVRSGEGAVLAMEPNLTQDLLSQVRAAEENGSREGRQSVILVADWQVRRPLRRLVELEFPAIRVVARREILDPAALPTPAAVIGDED